MAGPIAPSTYGAATMGRGAPNAPPPTLAPKGPPPPGYPAAPPPNANGTGMGTTGAAGGAGYNPATTLPSSTPKSSAPLWDLDISGVERWVRSLAPGVPNTGGALFPKRLAALLAIAAAQVQASTSVAEALLKKKATAEEEVVIQKNHEALTVVGEVLVANLKASLISACNCAGGDATEPPAAKRAKTDGTADADAFHILDPSFSKDGSGRASEKPGAILSRLTMGGLINALSGTPGGVVDVATGLPVGEDEIVLGVGGKAIGKGKFNADKGGGKFTLGTAVPNAGGMMLAQLLIKAKGLHRSVAARTEMDVMSTTPRRIADLLCPELTDTELRSIRRRVYDTVVLGQGTHSSAHAAALEDGEREVPVATNKAKHELDQWKRCNTCGNNDQTSFVLDRKNGDLICTTCGTIVSESIMHEGSQFRKFEGEEDRNHHGDAPNPLFSNSHNMSTTLGGMSFQTGAGIGGFGSGAKGNIENVLRNAHAYTEMNISQFGKEEKKTRIGYKDRQKKDAFHQMIHAGDALGLHDAVVQRAKELFAGFRDDRELVVQFKGVVSACLCESFEQLSRSGRQILKLRAGESAEDDGDAAAGEGGGEGAGATQRSTNARASRRDALHSANLAGKGGLLLDTTMCGAQAKAKADSDASPTNAFESKPAGAWTLDDCKSWMIEASKSIAKKWSDAQQDESGGSFAQNGPGKTTANRSKVSNIPRGTKDELEGQLVEHTLKLCDFLESEMKKKSKLGRGGKAVISTPRVAEMGRLSIKWQHSHERGSGGKGGVGNSGMEMGILASTGIKIGQAAVGGRTAGQILLLLTVKKFGNAIENAVAGEAFHTELKALFEKEKASKWQNRRDEATNARLRQMNRKPWLTARAQES